MQTLNLTVRFVLELAALFAFGAWGFSAGEGALRYVLAGLLPLVAAAAWGTFAVPGDRSRSGRAPVPIAGPLRLVLEAAFFGGALWATWRLGKVPHAMAGAGVLVVHYAVSRERVAWLLKR
ncbi:MAG TPA: YrdB family protein [Polyangiaceae bacterium]|nr:YrdB family protein [Polyangiaceae bacterium]